MHVYTQWILSKCVDACGRYTSRLLQYRPRGHVYMHSGYFYMYDLIITCISMYHIRGQVSPFLTPLAVTYLEPLASVDFLWSRVRLAQAVGRWICNMAAWVRFSPCCCRCPGSVVPIPIDSIIDRTKNTSVCTDISENFLKGTLNTNNQHQHQHLSWNKLLYSLY